MLQAGICNEDQVKTLRTPLLQGDENNVEEQIVVVGVRLESSSAPTNSSVLEASGGSQAPDEDQNGEEISMIKKRDLLRFTVGIGVGALLFAAINTQLFTHLLTNMIDIDVDKTDSIAITFAILYLTEFAIRCLGLIYLVVCIIRGNFGDISYPILGYMTGICISHFLLHLRRCDNICRFTLIKAQKECW